MPKKRKPARKPAATLKVTAAAADSMMSEDLRRMGSLLVVQGAAVDLGKHILCASPVVIGRDEDVDFPLSDGSISRAHCCVERTADNSGYILRDLNSTNGTTLNQSPVGGKTMLETGDKIFLGASVLRFSYSDSVDVRFHSTVEELVQTDGLTGLDCKRQYDAVFEVVALQAQTEGSPLSVLVLDLDGLKAVNDQFGHEMGSQTIVETANWIRKILDPFGHLARFGGDEFVCCLPGIGPEKATALAEELRAALYAHRFTFDGIVGRISISIGVASFPAPTKDTHLLFKAADAALYRAKRAGKNRVNTDSCG